MPVSFIAVDTLLKFVYIFKRNSVNFVFPLFIVCIIGAYTFLQNYDF